ncbi:MAG: hypothetical protein HZA89_16475 [Verrucomicrobia bacterium]|nr:hypothetical protein [Verrucomicrobiota bacterium]
MAEVTTFEELESELDDFRVLHPARGFLRKRLQLRVSTTKLRRLSEKYFRPPSEMPFPAVPRN